MAALLVIAAAIVAGVAYRLPDDAPARIAALAGDGGGGSRDGGALGEAGGAVPDGTTAFDRRLPAVARLDPALLDALRRAANHARGAGLALNVTGGWRSAAYEEHLLRQAVARYGSREEAARWVATPATSAHVSGDAVDVGPPAAARWLSANGAGYGLCRIYVNEPWHFELRPTAARYGCPSMFADATRR